jgi:hypothetical protein
LSPSAAQGSRVVVVSVLVELVKVVVVDVVVG